MALRISKTKRRQVTKKRINAGVINFGSIIMYDKHIFSTKEPITKQYIGLVHNEACHLKMCIEESIKKRSIMTKRHQWMLLQARGWIYDSRMQPRAA